MYKLRSYFLSSTYKQGHLLLAWARWHVFDMLILRYYQHVKFSFLSTAKETPKHKPSIFYSKASNLGPYATVFLLSAFSSVLVISWNLRSSVCKLRVVAKTYLSKRQRQTLGRQLEMRLLQYEYSEKQ